jgi:putative ABC transport system substrate-binding protein
VTGVDLFSSTVGPKRLEMLRELAPHARVVGLLVNSTNPNADGQIQEAQAAANKMDLTLHVLAASRTSAFEEAFGTLAVRGIQALLVGADPFFNSERQVIVDLASRYAVPAVYQWREFVEAGGLMSYGTSLTDVYRKAGIYTGRILKGEAVAELPVLQPTEFEMALNMRTARALGIVVPPSIVAQADEVIE